MHAMYSEIVNPDKSLVITALRFHRSKIELVNNVSVMSAKNPMMQFNDFNLESQLKLLQHSLKRKYTSNILAFTTFPVYYSRNSTETV
jgi:hypothetical protein